MSHGPWRNKNFTNNKCLKKIKSHFGSLLIHVLILIEEIPFKKINFSCGKFYSSERSKIAVSLVSYTKTYRKIRTNLKSIWKIACIFLPWKLVMKTRKRNSQIIWESQSGNGKYLNLKKGYTGIFRKPDIIS